MLPYFIVYFFILISTNFLYKTFKKKINNENLLFKQNRNYVIFCSCILIFLLGLRHKSMGADLRYGYYGGYLWSFENINTFSWFQLIKMDSYFNYEKGYILFNKLVGSLFLDTQFFLFSCVVVIIISLGYIVSYKSKDPMLSFIIYMGLPVFLINFSGLRQAIAVAITFFSIKFIQSKKIVSFSVAVIIAYFFHASSFVFLIAYPLYYIKKGWGFKCVSIMLLPIIFVFRMQLFVILSKLFADEAIPFDNGDTTVLLVFCLIYLFSILIGNQKDRKINGYTNLFYCACISQIFSSVFYIAARVGYYFMIFLILLLPEILEDIKFSNNYLKYYTFIKIFIIVAFISFGLYCLSLESWPKSNPYILFWK